MAERENLQTARALTARKKELAGNMKLAGTRLAIVCEGIHSLEPTARDIATEGVLAARKAAKSLTDRSWVQALEKAGVPTQLILNAWDKKDDLERQEPLDSSIKN